MIALFESYWLPLVRLTGANLFLPFAWAAKPVGDRL